MFQSKISLNIHIKMLLVNHYYKVERVNDFQYHKKLKNNQNITQFYFYLPDFSSLSKPYFY